MTRQEFLNQVLSPLGRLTAEERENVRRELEEHVEDRMEALLEMGWDAELAEARCLEAMGDPAEIGREMARQYRGRGWLWIGRMAVALTVVVCIQALLGLGMLGAAWDSLSVRFCPSTAISIGELENVETVVDLDIRAEIGNDILRVYMVFVGEKDGQRAAMVLACMYDRLPFGIVADGLASRSELWNERGGTGTSAGGSGNYRAEYAVRWTPVEPGDTHVVWEYRAIGETVRLEIPLPGGEETV
ncbi:permease prefix domain 1-containing protein [uncultured Oscillibacter sp.]|uniref:HAAS signaling domain-containing protein n=1 Tax=uncultured Oscillibacter sp. TaxID=876091 RepID=UPI0025DDBAA4|nr:permease prefix domain 1-containing protein [uncultured Oscillibacter sp.]